MAADENRWVVTHGGAGSSGKYADGPLRAAKLGMQCLSGGRSALAAACAAVEDLEEDGRFNAGVGSHRRADGSAQMDAACMSSDGHFGAVAVVEGFRNPIRIAQALIDTPCRVLAGEGAARFARECNLAPLPGSLRGNMPSAQTDTVGSVAFDGETFAAALSTGGTRHAWPGRVGDVPLLGCGLYAGPDGAVAATGKGEAIIVRVTAYRVYQLLERGALPEIALKTGLSWFAGDEDIGLILVSRRGYAGGSNRDMAWGHTAAR